MRPRPTPVGALVTALTALAALAALIALPGCSGPASPRPVGTGLNAFPAGSRPAAPDVAGTLLGGGHFDSSSTRGSVLVLNFWGSWCSPCRAEAPALQAVWLQTRASGVRLVGVDIEDSTTEARNFRVRHGLTYPTLFDPDNQLALLFHEYPPVATPTTYVIDRNGRIADLIYGETNAGQLLGAIRKARAA